MDNLVKKLFYKLKIDKCFGRVSSLFSKRFGKSLRILSEKETVEKICNNRLSVSRFGDGELHIAQEGCAIGFQKADKKLQARLKEILCSDFDNSKICVCLPSCINDVSWMTDEAKDVWEKDLKYNRCFWRKMINKRNIYGDTQFTRPYIDYIDKSKAKERFERIRKIWNNRDLLVVEGEKSKLGVGNDLFSDCSSIKRILCPPKDAFEKYNDIMNTIKKYDRYHLILIALGPTATVLAYDLCQLGYQAVDIGHIDIEYEWCLSGVEKKEAVKGKYTNESMNNDLLICVDNNLKEYNSEIVERIL